MGSTGQRRYRIGTHPEYDQVYDHKIRTSTVLNDNAASFGGSESLRSINNLSDIERILAEWTGQRDDGYYYDWNEADWKRSILQKARDDLQQIKDDWDERKLQALKMGKRPPEEEPSDLKARRLHAEAVHDVVLTEVKHIKKIHERLEKRANEQHRREILQYGPRQSGRLQGGVLVEIDKQNVSQTEDGLLYIDDSASPYDGMLVQDYRDMAKQWTENRRQEQRKRQKLNGRPVLQGVMNKIPEHKLPTWPKWARNMKKQAKQEE